MGSAAPAPPALTIHVPIEIFGESNFTAANGVSAGTGSPEDPFVVENLEIDRGGSYIGLVVYNTTSHLIIRNISILNGTFGYGIYLASASNVTVEDASVSGGVWAIMTEDSRDISISRLTATLGFGVDFTSSDRVALRDSRLLGNQTLVYVESTTHATLKNVSIERGALSFAGTEIEHYRSHSINSDVTVSGMPIQYVTDCTGAQAPAPGVVEFLMFGCEDVVIKDTIFEAPQGFMHFAFVRGLTLTGNTFRNGFGGFSASYATDVRVDANTFEASASGGIHVSNSERVEISANALRLTSSFGVMLSNVSDFAVSGNALRGGLETAVSVAHSRHGSIGANVIDNTSNAGIELAASSQILASSNTVTNAKAFGLRLSSVSDSRVEANTIVRAGGVGLSISGSQAVAIVGNDLADGDVGIDLDGVTGGALLDNRIVGHAAAGLRLGAVQDLTIDRNTLEGNAHGVEIGEGYGFDPGTLGIGPANFVDGRPIVYRSGCEGNTVEPVSPYLAIIANCTNVLITNGTFDGAHSRLWLYGVEGGQVTGLRFNGSHGTPLRVENSQNVSVADNSFSNLTAAAAVLVDSQNLSFQRNQVETAEGQGVDLEDCAKCTVSQNRLVASNASAIRVFGSDDVAVEGNEINDSLRGVSVFYSDRVRIQDNTIARSLDAGISTSSTTDLSILGNRIESSRVAGMSLSSGRYTNVSGNRITGSPDGLAIERTRSVYVWLNDFSSNSNHALRVTESSRIFVFSNNFDRASGSIAQDADRTNFHRGWITGGNFWAGHAIHDQCSGPFQSTACGSPDGFEDDSFLIDGVWRAWYSLGEPAVDADHDMMADSWEERFGLDPSDPADAGADRDADGLTNLQEFFIGASPVAADTDADLDPDATDDLVWWPNEEYENRQSVKLMGIIIAGVVGGTVGFVLVLQRAARKAQRP